VVAVVRECGIVPLAVHTAGPIRGAAARIVRNVMTVLATGFAATATPARRRGGARALQKGIGEIAVHAAFLPTAVSLAVETTTATTMMTGVKTTSTLDRYSDTACGGRT
jgi:hypothetical protein